MYATLLTTAPNSGNVITNARKKELIDNKANYLVDGTGGSYKPIEKQVIGLRAAGYDVAMIYIDIDLDTSIARDISRGKSGGRRLGAKTVERDHMVMLLKTKKNTRSSSGKISST